MGLFSTKKKVKVSSAIYNLAGDKIENFIRQTIFQTAYLDSLTNYPANLVGSILNSPGFKLRRYFSWCQNTPNGQEYCNLIGHYYTSFGYTLESDQLSLIFKDYLNLPESQNIRIDFIEIGDADFYYWGAKFLAENYPQYIDESLYDFICDYDYVTETISITVYDLTTETEIETIIFQPTDYYPHQQYLYIAYQIYDLVRVEREVGGGDNTHTEISYEEPDPPVPEDYTYIIYAQNTSSSDPNYNAFFSSLFDSLDTDEDRTFILPPIPFRLDNQQLSSDPESLLYKRTLEAAYKAFGDRKTYKKLDKAILENPSIGDLDYVYCVFGVSINTKNWAGKRYLYDMMAYLYPRYAIDHATYMAVSDMNNRHMFEYKIAWKSIEYGAMGVGNEFPTIPQWARDAFVKDEKYAVCRQSLDLSGQSWIGLIPMNNRYVIYFIHREDLEATQYTFYRTVGLVHYNYVHKGKGTSVEAYTAFEQSVYEESPFIFPLHEGIYKNLPTLTQAQLSMSFSYLLFNCYVIQKVKWYQRGVFKAIVIIVVIVIVVVVTICSSGSGTAPATKAGAAVVSALVGAGVGTAMANLIAVILEQLAAALISTIVAKIVTAGAKALGFNSIIANIAGALAGAVTFAGLSYYLAANAASLAATSSANITNTSTQLTSTAAEITVDSSYSLLSSTAETTLNSSFSLISSTENSMLQLTSLGGSSFAVSTAQQFTEVSLLSALQKGLYSIFTSPIEIGKLSLSLTDAGIKGYYTDKMQSLQKYVTQINYLSDEISKAEQEFAEMTVFSDWSKQLTLWRAQTSIDPESFLAFSLMSSSDIIDTTLEYGNMSLDPSFLLTYPS